MYLIIDLFFKKNLKMVQITLTLSVLVQSADSQLHYDYPPPYNNYIQVDKPVQNIYNEPHYGYDYNMDQQRFGYDNKNCMCSCDNCKQPSICCVEACSQCLMYPTTKLIMYVTYPMMIITKIPYATKSNEKSTTTEPKTQDKDQEQEIKTTSIKETTRNPPTQDQDQEKETKTTSIEETKPPTQDQEHETKTTSIEETTIKSSTQDEENVVQTTSIEETTTKLPTQDQENETQTTSIDETTTKPPTQDQDQKEQIEPTDTRRFFRRWLPTIDKTEPQGKKEIGDITLQKLMYCKESLKCIQNELKKIGLDSLRPNAQIKRMQGIISNFLQMRRTNKMRIETTNPKFGLVRIPSAVAVNILSQVGDYDYDFSFGKSLDLLKIKL